MRGKKFLAKVEQGRIHLLDLSSKKLIGQGALGTVYKVNNIFQQSPMALKLAQPKRKEDQKIAEKDVEKEAQIINRLEPESIIYFNCKNNEMSLVGHAGPLFKSGNLFEWLQKNHPEKERLDLFFSKV